MGLSLLPDEMPTWLPWVALVGMFVVLGVVMESGRRMIARQKAREYHARTVRSKVGS